MQNVREYQIQTPIFTYIENIFKKFVRFLEKICGLSKKVCTFVGAPDKPCGVGRADANPKLLLNDT